MPKQKQPGHKLIAKYGKEVLDEAIQYYNDIGKHCIMSELEEMCDYIYRMKENRR